ncbi:DNA-binding transcriptional regulator, XRE-family HTH domain [Bacteroides luti]|jgi:transcriptional regulator with XRE-family HTH domain|uniref:DNA-binding transcriptional regulator, XRE-family HTH domain n=1 Tax=Bacteroides luti TaxID=1297750 RepID=A0A1M4SNR1_9BACE|nr:helix-turn-helix transcriptional regulator [Bacteroides luti]SHE33845.1 DNA-binding transcriptional regulator, XRE-family HTH domain [Bacteroides luti]
MKDRIEAIMKREHMTPSSFAESIEIQRSTLTHILRGRNNPSLDVVMKIHQRFKYVNLDWLLYGNGNMINQEKTSDDLQRSLFDENEEIKPIPQVDLEYRKEMPLKTSENTYKEPVKEEIRYIERPPRKITEIRIFFDDNTFEIFKGEKMPF